MSTRYGFEEHFNKVAITSTTGQIALGPICIQDYETISMQLRNEHSAVDVVIASIDVSLMEQDSTGVASSTYFGWNSSSDVFRMATAVSALANAFITGTTNYHRYMRVVVGVSADIPAGKIHLVIGGGKRGD